MSKPHDTVNYNILWDSKPLELCKKYKQKDLYLQVQFMLTVNKEVSTVVVKERQKTMLKNIIKDITLILQF